MKRFLVYQDDRSNKFWEIQVEGDTFTAHYGRIGTKGQTTLKEFDDAETCAKAAQKLIDQKLRKGYVDGGPDPAEPPVPAKKSTKKKATKKAGTKKKTTAKKATSKAPKKKTFSPRTIKSFYKSIGKGDLDRIRRDIERGLPLDGTFDYWDCGQEGETPLNFALSSQKEKSAKLLVEAGADVNATGEHGYTALHHAFNTRTAKLLLDKGADVNARTVGGVTPLHRACQDTDLERVRLLVKRGAEVDGTDENDRTGFNHTFNVAIRDYLKEQGARGLTETGGRELSPTSVEPATFDDVSVDRGFVGVDHDGNVWLGGYSGLFKHDGDNITHYTFEESFALDGFALGPDKTFYIATNWGLVQVDGESFRLHDGNNSGLHDSHITYLTSDANGAAHIVCYENEANAKHISVFDGRGDWRLLRPDEEIPRCDIDCIGFDSQGELMLGQDKGYWYRHGGVWLHEATFGEEKAIFVPHVYDIVVDGDTTWLATHKGLYRRRGDEFTRFETENLAKHLCLDGDVLWIGTYFGGIYRLQISEGKMALFNEENSALEHDDIEGLSMAPDGTIWVHASSKLAQIKDGEIEDVPVG